MVLTQKQTDKIVQDIKDHLAEKFGDIENIDLKKAIEIATYCERKTSIYNTTNTPVEYGYWFYLARAYKTAVNATIEADKDDD